MAMTILNEFAPFRLAAPFYAENIQIRRAAVAGQQG